MPSQSPAQHNFMEAVDHDPGFARKVGVPQTVGQDFVSADNANQATHRAGYGQKSFPGHQADRLDHAMLIRKLRTK